MTGTAAQTLALLLIGGAVIGAAVWMVPSGVDAAPSAGGTVATDPEHQRTLELLEALIAGSEGVVAIHPRRRSSLLHVVLGLPGSEHALITHSRITQAITFAGRDDAAGEQPAPGAAAFLDPAFCDGWRTDPSVRSRVIARGVEEMQVTPAAERGGARIALTWAPDPADGR